MHRIGFLVTEGFQMMSFATQSVFEFANLVAEKPIYDIEVISKKGGPVKSSLGITLETKSCINHAYDTIIVCGVVTADQPVTDQLLDYLSKSTETSRRVASICTGAFTLAEAGLLNGRRATTHWLFARELQRRYPNVKIEEDRIFIIDGTIWTSAGMTAGLDLAVAMVEKDLGAEIARSLTQKLVMHHRRSGGQSQHSELLQLAPKSDRIQNALNFAKKNLHTSLTVEQLAEAANLSPRHFSRAFRIETGQTPAKAVENLRLETARLMIEQTHHPIDVIAQETGFIDRRRMREVFLRVYGQPPQVFRRNARMEMTA